MHRLLERQLRKHCGGAGVPPGAETLIAAVEAAYVQADADRQLIERSLEEMSRELTERNADLRRQVDMLQATEDALRSERAEQTALIVKLEAAHNQLLQSEKLASIGQLAAGVAHEINNPIGFVSSNLATLASYADDLLAVLATYEADAVPRAEPEAAQRIEAARAHADIAYLRADIGALLAESRDGLERVKHIVQDLKDFSRVDAGEWGWADLHRGIESTLNVVNNEIKYKAEVRREYGRLPQVECLASQLNQVFMNLLVNAAQAIEDHGTIVIRTGVENDERVWVEIADTGCGIPPDNLRRIFDPFFTTKPVGKGTGLGLSLAYGIVQKHGGSIAATSEPGRGACFRIVLPVRRPVESADGILP